MGMHKNIHLLENYNQQLCVQTVSRVDTFGEGCITNLPEHVHSEVRGGLAYTTIDRLRH